MAISEELERSDLEARSIVTGERAGYDTRRHLEYAKRQAIDRNLQDVLIIDADAHHFEMDSWPDIVKYIEDPVVRHSAETAARHGAQDLIYSYPRRHGMAGRVIRVGQRKKEETPDEVPRNVTLIRRQMQAIGIDYQIIFPNSLLSLSLHPDAPTEARVAWAYCRWLTEEILPHEPRVKALIYLPFNEPEASLRHVEYFSDKPGVAGFMVSSTGYRQVHNNAYVPVYRALEERGMSISFHGGLSHGDNRLFEGMNKFISVHANAFVLHNMMHLTNMIFNGIPERFPDLKIVWVESGLAWLPYMAQRLDNEYSMRTSDAPMLTKKPSEYIRENFYYTSQPLEAGNLEALELTMRMINAETQLLFASDYPHWDFNLPSTIYDLPFLTDQAKRNILGENAKGVFGLKDAVPYGNLDDAD